MCFTAVGRDPNHTEMFQHDAVSVDPVAPGAPKNCIRCNSYVIRCFFFESETRNEWSQEAKTRLPTGMHGICFLGPVTCMCSIQLALTI